MLQSKQTAINSGEAPISDFESHENKRLTAHEMQLIEYSFFSLAEEIDLFYSAQKEQHLCSEIEFTEHSLEDQMMCILEALESYPTDSE